MKPDTKHKKGMLGQKEAELFLIKNGYKIIKQNFRIKIGEIDIIAQKENYIIFIEVKFRTNLTHGLPREAVGYLKQKKIHRTALYYISTNRLDSFDFRFDVIEVLEQNGRLYINHIQNAFDV